MDNIQTIKRPMSMRIVSVLLSVIMILSGAMSVSFSANATETYVDFDNAATGYTFKSAVTANYKAGTNTYKMKHDKDSKIWLFKTNGNTAYCVAPGGHIYRNTKLKDNDSKSNKYFDNLCDKNPGLRLAIGLAMYYGYDGDGSVTKTGTKNDQYAATQLIIWELITGQRSTDFTASGTTNYRKSIQGGNLTNFDANYNAIINACKNHKKAPSIANKYSGSAPTYTLKSTDGGKTYTYTTAADTSGQLSSYEISAPSGVTITKSGNKLVIKSTKVISTAVAVKLTRNVKVGNRSKADVVWGNWDTKVYNSSSSTAYTSPQVMVSSTKVDPVSAYIKIKTEALGNINVTKNFLDQNGKNTTAIDSTVAGRYNFKIKNSSGYYLSLTKSSDGVYTYKSTTTNKSVANAQSVKLSSSNKISIKNLPVGNYTIIETKDNGYYASGYVAVGSNEKSVSVKAGQTASVTITNTPTVVKITKKFNLATGQATDADYKGITLQISGAYTDSNGKQQTFRPSFTKISDEVYQYSRDENVSGRSPDLKFASKSKATISLLGLPITREGNKITYTIKETNDGSGSAGKWFTFKNVTFTIGETNISSNPVKKTGTNNEVDDGTITITKALKYKLNNTVSNLKDGVAKDANGNTLTLQQIYDKLRFTVTNKSTNSLVKVECTDTEKGIYKVSTSNKAVTTLKLGTKSHTITITGLPFVKYTVNESNTAGLTPEKKSITQTLSRKNTPSFEFKFTNTYEDETKLRVEKNFISEGETDDEGNTATSYVNVRPYAARLITFIIRDQGNKEYVVADNNNDGTYTYKNTVDDKSKATEFKLYTINEDDPIPEYYFEVYGLENHIYNVYEIMHSNTIMTKAFQYKVTSEFDGQEVQAITEYIPQGLNRVISFDNIEKHSSIQIIKESEDDDVERTFQISAYYNEKDYTGTTIRHDLDDVYTIKTERKTEDGKVFGYAEQTNLPIYISTENSIQKIIYVVEEVDVPDRYSIIGNKQEVVLAEDDGTVTIPTVTIKNELKKGSIDVIKTKEVNGQSEHVPFAGVSFKLTNNYDDTEVVLQTDENGRISFNNLVGEKAVWNSETNSVSIVNIEYTVSEIDNDINKDYILNDSQTISFDYTDTNLAKTLNFDNELKRGSVLLKKVDHETKNPMTNAIFTLYKVEGNSEIEYGKLQQSTVEDEDGTSVNTGIYSLDEIPMGTYKLTETVPEGYIDYHQSVTFTLTDNNQFVVVYTDEEGNILTADAIVDSVDSDETEVPEASEDDETEVLLNEKVFYNFPIHVDITLYKVNSENTSEKLSGAIFVLYKDLNNNGVIDADDEKIGTFTEGKDAKNDPIYTIKDISYGEYLITETAAPEGYERDITVKPISVKDINVTSPTAANKKIDAGSITNTPIRGSVYIRKIDDNTMKNLSGAEFTIYNDVDEDGEYTEGVDTLYDADNSIIPENLNDGKGTGEYVLTEIPYGYYVVRETKAPQGFQDNNKVYAFAILNQGDLFAITDIDDDGNELEGIYNTPIRNDVELYKYDTRDVSYLAGKEFALINNENGQVAAKATSETKTYNFGTLEAGRYTMILADNSSDVIYNVVKVAEKTDNVTVDLSDVQFPLEGAEFTIYYADGKAAAEPVVTDKSGYAQFPQLLYGQYTVKETKAPINHDLSDKVINVNIESLDKTYAYTVENTKTEGKLVIKKTSEDGVIANVKFHVYGTSDTNEPIDFTARTDENGVINKTVLVGTYKVEELEVEDRYMPQSVQTVTVTKDNTTENPATVNFNNVLKKGNVEVLKFDEEYPDNKLEKAEFTVYEDTEERTVVGTLTEEETGVYRMTDLPYGNYVLKETVAPIGFNLDENTYTFQIRENGKTVNVENDPGKGFADTVIKGNILITKIDPVNNLPLAGATFAVYDEDGNVVDTQTTDENGQVEFKALRYGKYTVKETEAPENYKLLDKEFDFEIVVNGVTVERTIENDVKTGNLIIKKTSEDGIVEGLEFHVYGEPIEGHVTDLYVTTNADGIATVSNLTVGEYTVEEVNVPERYLIPAPQTIVITEENTEDNPVVVEQELELNEDAADSKETDEASDTEDTNTVEFTNTLKKGTVKVTKVDKDYPDNKLTGAEFTIYNDENSNGKFDDGDAEVGKLTETDIGIYTYEKLVYGKYLLKETKAPEYYEIDDNYYAFEITENGQIVEVSNVEAETKEDVEVTEENKYFVNQHKPVDVLITKSDVSTGKLLPDCEMQILDENKNEIFSGVTDKNGEVWFKLQPGTYYYREIKAPVGYQLDDTPYQFVVKTDDTIVKCEMKDVPIPETPETPETPDTPTVKTGDVTMAVVAMCGIAAIVSAVVIYVTRKKEEEIL